MASRASLSVLRNRVQAVQQRTQSAHAKVAQRRASRRAGDEEQQKEVRAEVPTFGAGAEAGTRPQRPVTSYAVRTWFRQGLRSLYGDTYALPPDGQWWTRAELSMAKTLLNMYEPDLVQRAVQYFCRTWPQRVECSQGILGGVPSVNFLLKMHKDIFGEVQGVTTMRTWTRKGKAGRRNRRDVGEYTPTGSDPAIGWGDPIPAGGEAPAVVQRGWADFVAPAKKAK